MSVGVVNLWVRDRDFRSLGRGSNNLKAVLERLAWFCPTEDGSSVFPKIQTLADAQGVTVRAVQYSMRRLEELGFIEVAMEARQHVPRVYRINVDRILEFPLTETGRRMREREGVSMRRDTVAKDPDEADQAEGAGQVDEVDQLDQAREAGALKGGAKLRHSDQAGEAGEAGEVDLADASEIVTRQLGEGDQLDQLDQAGEAGEPNEPETPQNARGEKYAPLDERPENPRGEEYAGPGVNSPQPGVNSTSPPIEEGSLQAKEEGSLERASATGLDEGPDANAQEVPLVSQLWRDRLAELEALPCWPLLERCIPDSDDAETLPLAVESPVMGFALLAYARSEVEAVLGKRIAARVRFWVNPALHDRGIDRSVKPDPTRHRRDGEIVTLDDKAWRIWSAHAAEIEALPFAQSKVLCQCYPDDYVADRLFLCCASVDLAMGLYDVAGEVVGKMLGETIKPRIFHPLGVVLAMRFAQEQVAAAS